MSQTGLVEWRRRQKCKVCKKWPKTTTREKVLASFLSAQNPISLSLSVRLYLSISFSLFFFYISVFIFNGTFSASFSLFLYFQYSSQETVFNLNFADDWIQTGNLCCLKQPAKPQPLPISVFITHNSSLKSFLSFYLFAVSLLFCIVSQAFHYSYPSSLFLSFFLSFFHSSWCSPNQLEMCNCSQTAETSYLAK